MYLTQGWERKDNTVSMFGCVRPAPPVKDMALLREQRAMQFRQKAHAQSFKWDDFRSKRALVIDRYIKLRKAQLASSCLLKEILKQRVIKAFGEKVTELKIWRSDQIKRCFISFKCKQFLKHKVRKNGGAHQIQHRNLKQALTVAGTVLHSHFEEKARVSLLSFFRGFKLRQTLKDCMLTHMAKMMSI